MNTHTAILVTDHVLDGPHGTVPVRHYRVEGTSDRAPGLVWMHGGAFAFGELDMPEGDWVARRLAGSGIPVVSVDYRLAPIPTGLPPRPDADGTPPPRRYGDVRFPVASEEVLAAFDWAHAHAASLGIDPDALSIGGASAGANLAAGATVRMRDRARRHPGAPAARTLLLAYPLVHAELPEPSEELAAKLATLEPGRAFPPFVTKALNTNYVGDETLLADPRAFPGGHDLRGFPPTFVLNSDHDTLRSSGEAFAGELVAAGVDTLVIREDDTFHGHLNEPDNPKAHASIERMAAWLSLGPLVGRTHPRNET